MRVQHPDPAIEIETRDLDGSAKVAVVAHHERRLECSAVGEVDEVYGKADIRALLIGELDLDGPTDHLLRPDGERTTPGLDELPKADLAVSSRKERAEMRVLRLRQAWIDLPVEQRCVEMHALDAEEPRRKHGGCHAHKIDPVTGELPARSVHEVETVDEHAGAEPRHCKPSFPET